SEKIEKAFKLLISDKNLEAVFINIFGGILRCDFLAEGVKNAIKNLNVSCPVIVRMEGTNKDKGAEILNNSGLKFTVVKDLNEAIEVIRKI
ncbi:MAG: succinate--CoA ligase subunit beta, partial [Candidatus Gastranaerophilales bacterium]|nr:succinate--CoA ligase subunit beta [Candidatus Gastranaerophilales bacterium]